MSKWLLLRIIQGRPRLFAGFGVAMLSFAALTPVHSLITRFVLGWDIGSAVFLGLTAHLFFSSEDQDIRADAERQQEGEWSVFALTLVGAVMSFAAIFVFSNGSGHKSAKAAHLAFVVVTLALSWLTTQVTFAYRYAHQFYSCAVGQADPNKMEGGIEFPKEDHPDYLDFVYFSFVLGMTFQVSDCDITSRKMRRLATLHGLIGFLFNTVILALSVNIAASAIP